MSSITCQIELVHPQLFPLEFGKIAEYDFVHTLSTNINQSAPNLVKMYVTLRSQISSIIDQNCLSYLPLNLQTLQNLTLFTPEHLQCRPISTKHGHIIYYNEIFDEFDYGSNPTVTS